MILRREFFKTVLIGSIFALQFTITGPVYNALAVGTSIDKTPVEDFIPSNVDADKKTGEVAKVVSEKGRIDEEIEKAKIDEDFRLAENMGESTEVKRTESHKKVYEDTKAKEKREKNYNDLLKKYYDDIDDKYKELNSNNKKLNKIDLHLTSDNITEEEKQILQEDLNNITELNKELYYDISKIITKVEKIVSKYNKINQEAKKAKRNEEFRQIESIRKAIESKKADDRKKAEEAKKAKEKREKNYNDLIKKYYDEIDDKDKELKCSNKKLIKINLDLTSDKITEEEKQALQEELNNITKLKEKLFNDVLKILEKVESEKNKINQEARKAKRDEEFRQAENIKKAEEARKTEEAIKGYRIEKDINGKEWKLYSYKNDHDLTVKILTDEDFISNWASIADRLGFKWCGGTKTPWVGEDFSIKKTGDNEYTLSANYNPSDPFTQGEAANERLKIKVNNIRFLIDEDSLEYGEKKILSVKPITIAVETFRNEDDEKTLIGEFSFEYSKTTSITREDNFGFSQDIDTKTRFIAGIPVIIANERTDNVKVNFGQGWSDTKETSTTKTYTKKITVEITPKHKQRVELVATEQKEEIPYKANIYMSYDIALEGFLRREGNARVDHPTDRPYVVVNFSDTSKGKNALDFIKDIYDNNYIPGYSQWDFHWVDKQNKDYPIIKYINALSRYKVGGLIEGVFRAVDGTEGEVISKDQVPLSTPDTKEDGNPQDSVVFKTRELRKI